MERYLRLVYKKVLLVLLLVFTINNTAHASHVQGGEITMSCLGGNQYQIRLALYRDCNGINAPGSVSVRYQSISCGINQTVTLNQIAGTGTEVSPICPTSATACGGGNNPGVQEYIYTAIVNLPACADWVMSYSINARNNAISTINNPGGQSMYIESEIDNLNFPCNSSPTFTNKPVPFICVGQQYCFNNGASDLDGDSLSYSMVIPQTSATATVNYNAPYSATQPLASSPAVTIDPATGDICMTPTQLQVTVFAVLVTEWRNGVRVGEIRRDIQIRTITCNNTNPYLNGINNTGSYNMDHCIGTPINFNIPSFDDDGDNVTLTWNNGISGGTFTPGAGVTPTGVFSWNPTIADVSSTPYCFTISVVDDNCPYFGSQSYSFCITVGGFTTTTNSTDVLCTNSDGIAGVTAANSPGPFSYLWSAPAGSATTSSVNGLSAGNYSVTTSDALGCNVTDNITISSTDPSIASVTSFTDVSCNGDSDGDVTVTLTGAGISAPLTYAWTPAAAGNVSTASNLSPGTYSVIITDSQGCTDTVDQIITDPLLLTVNTTFVNVGCFGSSTGSATGTGTGGTGAYAYLWMPGAYNTSSIVNLPIGTYTVTVTDDNNCTATDQITIVQPLPLGITDVVTNANCGQADGSATVTGSGGFAPYTWLWSNGQTGATANTLSAGTYTVTITDGNFCTKTVSVSVGNNAGPTVQVSSVNDVTCNGGNNGNITVVMTGGASPYTYLWNNGQATPTASNLSPGLYSVTITDNVGCSVAIDTVIAEPTPLTNNFISNNPTCFGGSDGSATANPLGGTSPYTYIWSSIGNPTTALANNLAAGIYTVTITDANGCTLTQSVTLVNPPTVNTVITTTDVQCFGACDGIAATVITNGIAPYTYSWNDPLNQTTDTARFLCIGTYQVDVIDGNGCTSQAVTTINEPTELTTVISSKGDLICYQSCIGFAQVTATGGSSPYTYLWSNGDVTATATNLCAGSYSCTVTDDNGCTSIVNVTITEPAELVATITGTDILCFGSCDGTGNIAFSGGTAPYSFLWSPGLQTINNPNDLCVGQNIAEITDDNGCRVTDTITLTESLPILVTVQTIDVSNCGQANGGACVTPSGGLAPYSYVWNNTSVSNTSCITNEVAGTYSVDVTDDVGCLKTVVLNINDLAAPTVTIDSHTDLLCFGDTNGTATTTIIGSAPPYSILWTAGNQTVQNPTNLNGGTHTITVTDNAGCITSTSVDVLEPSNINSTIVSSTDVTCFSLCNGDAIASAVGGTGVLSYLWDDPSSQNTASAINLCAGTFTVTISDVNSCTKTNTVTIIEPDELVIDSNSFENLSCFEDNTGSIFTSVIGGTPFYTFSWTPNISSAPTANNLAAGNYSLQVTDQNGCTVNENWTVTEPDVFAGTDSQLDATCSFSNGTATINATGGTIPYFYQWNDPSLQTNSTANNLFAGNYLVNVTDNNNCTFSQSYTILDESGPIVDSVTFTAVSCFGGNNGTALVNLDPTAGTAPFDYAWNPSPQTLANISGLSTGTYTVLVTDDNGCTAGGNVTVTEPPLLELFASQDETICFGDTIEIYGQGSGGTQPYTYNWTGGTGLLPVGVNDVFPVGTTTYSVDVTDDNSCVAGPIDITITVLPTLNISVVDTFMCQGDSVLVLSNPSGGNGDPFVYSWDNGDTTQNTMVSPTLASSPIKYTITLNDGCSTPVYDTAIVIVNPTPIIDSITTSDVLCFNGNTGAANVFMNATVGTSPFTFDWGFISQTTPLVTGLSMGQYYVNVTDNKGCFINDSITIDQPDSLILTVLGDSICFGDIASISASTTGGITPYVYTWTGLTNPNNGPGPFQETPVTTTNYTVSVTDFNNCNVSPTTVQIQVGAPLSIMATDDVVCENKAATITASASGGGTPYTYSWGNGVNTQLQTVVINQIDTFIVVTLTDGCSTPAIDTSFITVNLEPIGSILALPNEGCVPLLVDFIAISNDGIQYYWNYGDNTTVATVLDTVNHSYINDGNFDISLTIINLEGCSTIVDSLNYIHVYPNPTANFSMSPNPATMLNSTIEFLDLSFVNISSWNWDFSGIGTSAMQSPSYAFPELPGDYPVSLKVTDINGCVDSITKMLVIKPEWAFYVPNSFTPDGYAPNNLFAPQGFGISEEDYSFYIYDRWGELIFETHTLFGPWDGTYKNRLSKTEVYTWKANFKDLDGKSHNKIGRISLLR